MSNLTVPFYSNEEMLLKWAKEHYGNKLSKAIKEHLVIDMNTDFDRRMKTATGDDRQKLIETAYRTAFGTLEREVERCIKTDTQIDITVLSTEVNHAKICLRNNYLPLYDEVMDVFNARYPQFAGFLKNRDDVFHPEHRDIKRKYRFRDYLLKGYDFAVENIANGIVFTGMLSNKIHPNRDAIINACKLYEDYMTLDSGQKCCFLVENNGNILFINLVAFLSTLENVDALDVYEMGSAAASWLDMANDVAINSIIKPGLTVDDIECVIECGPEEVYK